MLLSIVFSTIANAEEVEVKPYNIRQQNNIIQQGTQYLIDAVIFEPRNDFVEKWERVVNDGTFTAHGLRSNSSYASIYTIEYNDETSILEKGKSYNIRFNNFYHSLLLSYKDTQFYVRNPGYISIIVMDRQLNEQVITSYSLDHVNNTPIINLEFDIIPNFDVYRIFIRVDSYISDYVPQGLFDSNGWVHITSYFGEINGDDNYQFSMEVQSEEAGLLSGLLEWIKSIKSKIDDMFTNVSNGFSNISSSITNVVNNIIELPSKLWTLISDGLKALFVPDSNKIAEYREDWDMLLSQRFGAIYESGEVISNVINNISASAVMTVESDGIITIPKVNLTEYGIPFEFGGYEVDIKPDGFEFLITVCKRVISISCTLMFVNTLRKRYESVVHG